MTLQASEVVKSGGVTVDTLCTIVKWLGSRTRLKREDGAGDVSFHAGQRVRTYRYGSARNVQGSHIGC